MYKGSETYSLKFTSLLPYQAKDLAHKLHLICDLNNQKLQQHVLGKNPISVQNVITLAQKNDAELCIIEGLHNHHPEYKINHISNKQYQAKSISPGPFHICSGPNLIRDCKGSLCKRCKLNLDNHAPGRCPK